MATSQLMESPTTQSEVACTPWNGAVQAFAFGRGCATNYQMTSKTCSTRTALRPPHQTPQGGIPHSQTSRTRIVISTPTSRTSPSLPILTFVEAGRPPTSFTQMLLRALETAIRTWRQVISQMPCGNGEAGGCTRRSEEVIDVSEEKHHPHPPHRSPSPVLTDCSLLPINIMQGAAYNPQSLRHIVLCTPSRSLANCCIFPTRDCRESHLS